jgi:predicted amidophosphoribosyltransferase
MKYAYWIKNTHLFDPDDYKCSACGAKSGQLHDRCPNCGREMTGKKDGDSWVDEAAFLDFITGGL